MGGRDIWEDGFKGTTLYEPLAAIVKAYGVTFGTAMAIYGRMESEFTAGRMATTWWVIRSLGTRRFGPPPDELGRLLTTPQDPARLERMTGRLLDATGWDDLLATP